MTVLSEPAGFGNGFQVGHAEVGVVTAAKDRADMSPVFWTAFWTGMAAPISLFAAPPVYSAYIAVPTPAQSFSMVGALLNTAAQQFHDERQAA